MAKWLVSFLAVVLVHFCYGDEKGYAVFESIQEVIDFETACILNANTAELRSDAYAARGESYLLCGYFEKALDDFQQAYISAISISDSDMYNAYVFRALFDQALAYGNLNMVEMALDVTIGLKQILESVQCSNGHSNSFSYVFENLSAEENIFKCSGDTPIYGPDVISVQDCIDFVNNTIGFAAILISKAHPNVRDLLHFIIDQLGGQARYCCKAGGIWKGCVQQLVNKNHMWNQKWQVFGIPPDPAWD